MSFGPKWTHLRRFFFYCISITGLNVLLFGMAYTLDMENHDYSNEMSRFQMAPPVGGHRFNTDLYIIKKKHYNSFSHELMTCWIFGIKHSLDKEIRLCSNIQNSQPQEVMN